MKVFNLPLILKPINQSIVDLGYQYFVNGKVEKLDYKLVSHYHQIQAQCNHYQVKVDVQQDKIIDYDCECEQCRKYKIVCKHIVAVLYRFDELLNIKIKTDYKKYAPIVDAG